MNTSIIATIGVILAVTVPGILILIVHYVLMRFSPVYRDEHNSRYKAVMKQDRMSLMQIEDDHNTQKRNRQGRSDAIDSHMPVILSGMGADVASVVRQFDTGRRRLTADKD